MCGIFAYSNHNCPKSQKEIVEKLLTGLRRLEYRGYDSAGLAIDDGSDASHTEAKVFRQTGKIANLEALLRESERFIQRLCLSRTARRARDGRRTVRRRRRIRTRTRAMVEMTFWSCTMGSSRIIRR